MEKTNNFGVLSQEVIQEGSKFTAVNAYTSFENYPESEWNGLKFVEIYNNEDFKLLNLPKLYKDIYMRTYLDLYSMYGARVELNILTEVTPIVQEKIEQVYAQFMLGFKLNPTLNTSLECTLSSPHHIIIFDNTCAKDYCRAYLLVGDFEKIYRSSLLDYNAKIEYTCDVKEDLFEHIHSKGMEFLNSTDFRNSK